MAFLFILALFFFWRLLLLFFLNPLGLFVYVEEELYRGWIGKELLDGLKLSFYDYRADDYSGGSLLMGTIAAGFFKVFGLNAFALKMMPVCLFAGALTFWYFWLSQHQSRRLAVWFSILFIFSPYLFTRFSLTVLGDHAETIFFTAAGVFLLFKTLFASQKRWIYPMLLGLLSGLGLWMAYIYGITILSMLIYWGIQDRYFFKKRSFLLVSAFFLIGFSPWILINWHSHFQGLLLQGTPLHQCFHWKFFLKRLWYFRESSFYRLFSVHNLPTPLPEISPRLITHFYRLLFLMPAILLFIVRGKEMKEKIKNLLASRSPVLFSLIYLSVFLLISQATEFKEARYFIPAQPFVFFLSICALDGLTRFFSKPFYGKLIPGVFFAAVIFGSAAFHAPGMSFAHRGKLFYVKPYSLNWFLLSPVCQTPDMCLETYKNFRNKENLSPEEILIFRSGVAQKLLEEIPFLSPLNELKALRARSPQEAGRDQAQGSSDTI